MTKEDVVYNAQLAAFTLYHQLQESSQSNLSTLSGGPALPALGHGLAGALATASSKLLLYPIELVTTRLQVQRQLRGPAEAPSAAEEANAEYKSFLDAFRKIYRNEGGVQAFYTGLAPDVGKGIADSFLFFLAYTFFRQRQLRKDGGKDLAVVKELSIGIVAGSFAKLITTPLQNLITRKQTAALVAARDPALGASLKQGDKLTLRDIANQIHSERGLAGFWAGYSASTILTLNPAITFAVENLLRRLLNREKPGTQLTFLLAAVSKAIATSLTYPVMLAKSRAQAVSRNKIPGQENPEKKAPPPRIPGVTVERDAEPASGEPKEKAKRTAVTSVQTALRPLSAQYAIFITLRNIYRQEGLEGLYSGIEGEVLKGFISHGLTMMVKEKAHVAVIQTYYILLRLTKRLPEDLVKAKEGARELAGEVKERVENVGVTVQEGLRSIAGPTLHDVHVSHAGSRVQAVALEAKERAENLSTTVAEGAKQMKEHGKNKLQGS